jgi:hypothetical protein
VAIAQDASTPAAVPGPIGAGSGTPVSTAAFSPPSGSLLLAMVVGGWGSSAGGITVTDSGSHTWTVGAVATGTGTNKGVAAIVYTYLSSAPGSITVSAAFTGGGGGRLLDVRVLTGAAASQTGAATASTVRATASTAGTVSVTPTVVGSQIYGASDDPDTNATFTANGATTILTNYADTTDNVHMVSWKATATTTTTGSPITYGGTWGSAQTSNTVAFEVLPATGPTTYAGAATLAGVATFGATAAPAPGIAEDASTPAIVNGTGTGDLTTPAFSPPANSLLVALVAGGWNAGTTLTTTSVADSGSHTWTSKVAAQGTTADRNGIAQIYECYLTSAPGSITVTASFAGLTGGRLLAVRVLTGVAADQSAAATGSYIDAGNSAIGTFPVVTTVTKSVVYGVSDDPYTAATWTPNAATTALPSGVVQNATDGVTYAAWKATNPTTTPGSTTLGGTWAATTYSNQCAVEVLPTAALPGAATMAGAASFAAAAILVLPVTATLVGAGTLTAAAAQAETAAAPLAGASSFTAAGTRVQPGAATLAGVAGFTSVAALTAGVAVTLSATAGFTAAAFLTEPAAVTLAGLAALTAAGIRVQPGAVAFAGAATFTAAGVSGAGATLVAVGSLSPAPFQALAAAVAITGVATFGGPSWVTERVTVTMTGLAGLAANLSIPASTTLPATSTLIVGAVTVFAGGALLAGQATLNPAAKVAAAAAAVLPGIATLAASAFRIAGGIGVLFTATATLRAGATGTTPGQVLSVTFWALNNDGTYNVALPDLASWQISLVESSPGAVTLDYPADGRNFDVLRSSVTADRDLLVAIWIGGKDPGSLRAILNTAEGDDVAESAVWRFSGNFLNVRMEEATVAPRTTVVTPPTGPAPTEDLAAFRVYAATAGTIMGTLMQEAQARGTLTDITYIFTGTVDSHGIPWSKTITLKISPGTDYLAVLAALVEALMCEWEIVDHELVLWDYGTRGTDYTTTTPPIILRAGDTLTDSPRKHTVRAAGTTLTVAGGEGLYTTVSDASAVARRGRRIEQYISQGSLTDPGSLSAYATAKLPSITAGTMEVGGGIALTGIGPEPLIAYRNGDWIWSDTGLGLERLRIKQLTVSCDSNGILTAGLSLNDLIADQLEQLAHRMAGIEGGTTITGTSNASPVIPDAPDTMPPTTPQGLVVTSLAQPSPDLVPRSAVFASWSAVTTNVDTTAISDLAGYTVQWRYLTPPLTNDWNQLAAVSAASTSWSGVIAGQSIEVRVRAFDTTGNQSGWSTSAFHTTQTDATPPPVPSTPVVTEFLGTLTVTWDGLGSAGETMPSDFAGVQVHRSTTSGFTPGSATFIENMTGAGARNYPDLPLGVTQFFKLISYDRAGNLSAASAQGSAIPMPIGMGDIAFTDPGNLVEDGSFEVATSRATHAARSDTAWSFVTGGADHGSWFVRGSGAVGSGLRPLVLSPLIPTTPGSDYAIRWAMRATGVNGDVSMRIRWTLTGTTTDTIVTFTPGFSGSWTNTELGSGTYTAPTGAVSLQIIVMLHANCTAGTWDLDRIEARETIGTLLVRNLAVTDAQIASASVGKLTAGTITAVMLMAGLLRSGTTGLRYELDANGLRFYDAGNNVVIDLNRASASAVVTGTVRTGTTGRYAELSGAGNNLRFYPAIGTTRYAQLSSYVDPAYPNDVVVQLQAISSTVTDVIARLYATPGAAVMAVESTSGDLIGGSVKAGRDTLTIAMNAQTVGIGAGGAVQGGLVNIGRSFAQFGLLGASPTLDAQITIQSPGTITITGAFQDATAAGGAQTDHDALVVGSASVSGFGLTVGTGWSMQGTMHPIVTLQTAAAQPVAVTSSGATNFSVAWGTSQFTTVHYWDFRTA